MQKLQTEILEYGYTMYFNRHKMQRLFFYKQIMLLHIFTPKNQMFVFINSNTCHDVAG